MEKSKNRIKIGLLNKFKGLEEVTDDRCRRSGCVRITWGN